VHYLHYMSVKVWGVPGGWRTNYGGIALSRDGGATWQKDRTARWRNTLFGRNRFQLGAFARDEDWVYLFGTRNGRAGPVHLARVHPDGVGQPKRYRYWTGTDWKPWWRLARQVSPGPAGELSVAYHRGLGLWLMVHLQDKQGRIVRRARRPGPGAIRGHYSRRRPTPRSTVVFCIRARWTGMRFTSPCRSGARTTCTCSAPT
jgi:hypothetical protein